MYTEVQFPSVDRGDIELSTSLTNRNAQRLELGITVNTGAIRHAVQSDAVHRTLGIPEFPRTDHVEVMLYIRLLDW